MKILNENGKIEGVWKKCKKKQYVIKARKDGIAKDVYNCLENCTVSAREDEIILRGLFGEEWPIGKNKFLDRYVSTDGGSLDDLVEQRYFAETDVLTKASETEYYCLFVPKDQECAIYGIPTAETENCEYLSSDGKGYRALFSVNSKDSLSDHGNGDYIVCMSKDGKPDIEDMWVVDGNIFLKTYRLID